MKTPPIYSAS